MKLIECNTNPCLEESNSLLAKLVPRMLDDLLKIVLPQLASPHVYSVDGYADDEQMWE